MDENLKHYLENTIVKKSAFESRITHPIIKLHYPKRAMFTLLKKYVDDFLKSGSEPRFVSLAGLRGVGKTTLLWQTANHIFTHHNKEIYFFNVNTLKNLGISLHIALEEFQRNILKKRFNELSEPITLLFDEVHDDENWDKTLKILYDEARTAIILCTGSSALLLNSTADLARRMHTQKVYPFSLIELLSAKNQLSANNSFLLPNPNVESDLLQALFFSENHDEVFENLNHLNSQILPVVNQKGLDYKGLISDYINFQNFPNLLFYNDEIVITNAVLDLFKRIIHEDIPKLKPNFSDFAKVERLILRLAGSDEINPEKLSGIIGVKHNDINELIDILAKAEILNILLPYGGLDSKIAKNKKAFFMSPTLRRALLSSLYGHKLPDQLKSKLIEDIVVMYLRRVLTEGILSFLTGSRDANPDLVVETREKPILLEIGTQKTTVKQLKSSNVPYRYGLLVSNGVSSPSLKGNCIQLPLSWFLFL